jgi:hypothetical protein
MSNSDLHHSQVWAPYYCCIRPCLHVVRIWHNMPSMTAWDQSKAKKSCGNNHGVSTSNCFAKHAYLHRLVTSANTFIHRSIWMTSTLRWFTDIRTLWCTGYIKIAPLRINSGPHYRQWSPYCQLEWPFLSYSSVFTIISAQTTRWADWVNSRLFGH